MSQHQKISVWRFAFVTCLTCSLLLSVVYGVLKPRQEINMALDQKKHILKVVGLEDVLERSKNAESILQSYQVLIQEMWVDEHGVSTAAGQAKAHCVYVYHVDAQIVSYCFPFSGKGLWSTIEGYIALEADGQTLRGITFSSHGETPGLGGEIEQRWFTDNFKGKQIYDIDLKEFVALDILKGKALESIEAQKRPFSVDGITGATMTSNGVENILQDWLQMYKPFLQRIKG